MDTIYFTINKILARKVEISTADADHVQACIYALEDGQFLRALGEELGVDWTDHGDSERERDFQEAVENAHAQLKKRMEFLQA